MLRSLRFALLLAAGAWLVLLVEPALAWQISPRVPPDSAPQEEPVQRVPPPQGQRTAEPRRPPAPEDGQAGPRQPESPPRAAVPRSPSSPGPARPETARPGRDHRSLSLTGRVFIGGYFYDSRFGPFPWWPRHAYPWYLPMYDQRAEVRLRVTPRDAAVYVDGFYAGVVDDFDGVLQLLPLPSGGHSIVLFLEGHRTARYNLYLRPGSTFTVRDALERLPLGGRSEPPPLMPPVPPPPDGSYERPRSVQAPPVPSAPPPVQAEGFGLLALRVYPVEAVVTIDGAPWLSSEPGSYALQMPVGRHVVEVMLDGFWRFSGEVEIRDGDVNPLHVSLTPAR